MKKTTVLFLIIALSAALNVSAGERPNNSRTANPSRNGDTNCAVACNDGVVMVPSSRQCQATSGCTAEACKANGGVKNWICP